jgi:ferrochelatase
MYYGRPDFQHTELSAVGVLLANLGTPDAPDTPALRRYLREFLSDPRVIELPRFTWSIILNLFILPTRPAKSAELYRKIWWEEGSPLLVISRRQAAALQEHLRPRVGNPLHVAIGMRYGNPSIRSGLRELAEKGCRRILVLPLYPQYAGATVGSTFDAVAAELSGWRWVPEVRTVHGYFEDPAYIRSLAASIREAWENGGPPEKLLFSFHGIPQRYFDGGDPYFCLCQKSARLTAGELGLPRDRWEVSFQSLFGKEEWIKPYTDKTIEAMARSGIRSLDVICPGFSADCLETLEEIDGLNREIFHHAGGERFRYIPCLNDRPDHMQAIAGVVLHHLHGWVEAPGAGSEERLRAAAAFAAERAAAFQAAPAPADAGYGR